MELAKKVESDCATVDLTRLPLIVQTVKKIYPTIVQTQGHIDLAESILQQTSGPLYIISDMGNMQWVNIKSIIHLGRGIFELDNKYPDRIALHAFVNPSLIIRTLIPLFNLFARLDGHQTCTNNMDEAIDWISLESGIPFYE